jgi:formate dehydrogenase subunit gamma
MALKDPEARYGMRTGRVSRAWAKREHALWTEEAEEAEDDQESDRTNTHVDL